MHKFKYSTVLVMSLALTACEGGMDKQEIGTLAGAAGGALIGSEVIGGTVAIVAGAVAGAWLGGKLGKSLDKKDNSAMQQTTQQSLSSSPAGTKSTWSNPDSGNSGTVTPQKTFINKDGQECREYQQTVTADGKTETGYGTACKQSDGSWKIVSN